jgi:phage gp36-like protein
MYITKQDLIDELGEEKLLELADPSASFELDDPKVDAKINRVLSFAVGTFDSYARTRYTLPVPATEKVRATCVDLAVFKLFEGRATIADDGVYQVRKNSHDAALKFLKDVASGMAALDVPAAEETAANPATPDRVLRASDVKPGVFSDENLRGY